MTALAFVIFVHDRTGSFGSAGLVAGAGLGPLGTVWFVALPPLGKSEPAPPHQHKADAG